MKNIIYLSLLAGGFCLFLSVPARAESSKEAKNSVEVVVQGKQYKSIHAYKREQIKNTLKRALSSYNLMEFKEDELEDIMRQVRKHQEVAPPLEEMEERAGRSSIPARRARQKVMEEEGAGTVASQMQEMLDEYSQEHKDALDLELDPRKVKSIIIEP